MTRHLLPYAYAKAHCLLLEQLGEELVLWAPPAAPLPALSEVQRLYAVGRMESQDAALLMERIQSAYAGSESSAATVVGWPSTIASQGLQYSLIRPSVLHVRL